MEWIASTGGLMLVCILVGMLLESSLDSDIL